VGAGALEFRACEVEEYRRDSYGVVAWGSALVAPACSR
jgi:hypothetical protein